MTILENLTNIVQELKCHSLALFDFPTSGRASIINENLCRQILPARDGLGVLVKENPEYSAYFAPIAPIGMGIAPISYSGLSAVTGGGYPPPLPFKIILSEDGMRTSTCVSEEVAKAYSKIVAEMVEASQTHKLHSLPSIEGLLKVGGFEE